MKQKKAVSPSFIPKRSRCLTLLGSEHLGDSELKERTISYCTETPYKSAETPRSQEVVVLATLKQKKAIFYFFTAKRSTCVTLLGSGHVGASTFNECTVIDCREAPYKSAKAPRSQKVVVLATLKQKKALFLLSHTKKVQVSDAAWLWASVSLRP